jgi:hypothetical protein
MVGVPGRKRNQRTVTGRITTLFFEALAPAQLGDRSFAAQAAENDADLLFGRMVLSRCPPNVADKVLGRHRPAHDLREWIACSPP